MKLWTLQYKDKITIKGTEVNCVNFDHFIFKFRMKSKLKKLNKKYNGIRTIIISRRKY
jgi:lauroyl/myristoyl acyltransferase